MNRYEWTAALFLMRADSICLTWTADSKYGVREMNIVMTTECGVANLFTTCRICSRLFIMDGLKSFRLSP